MASVPQTRGTVATRAVRAGTIPDTNAEDVYVKMPLRIIDDRSVSAKIRILAWLISHGANTIRAVRVPQAVLARQLRLSESTIRSALKQLGRAGYITAVHDPLIGGNVRSYRLLFSHEQKGA